MTYNPKDGLSPLQALQASNRSIVVDHADAALE